jgi:hypothetical protein
LISVVCFKSTRIVQHLQADRRVFGLATYKVKDVVF